MKPTSRPFSYFFLPLLGSSVAGFFGRFLGSEGSAFTGKFLLLFGLLLLGGIFFFRQAVVQSVWRESFFLNQECLSWINLRILHNSSGYAFSSLLSIF